MAASAISKAGSVRQVSAVKAREQARRIPALAAHLLDLGVELVDQRGDRQVGAVAAGFGQRDREVLAHPFDREAEIVLVLVHGLVAVLHLPGLRGAFGDGLDHCGDVEATLLGEVDTRGKAPSAPIVTARKSLSLPTQHITKSWPSAAAFGVAAVLPPNLSAHSFALAAVRL